MSLRGKIWNIRTHNKDLSAYENLMNDRKNVLKFELKEFHDPYLFEDMQKAVDRITEAIEKKERIIVFGDYDVDGITGTAILFRTLSELGANVSYRIPHRELDGYALSDKFIEEFIEKKVSLIITVDCGISCGKQITDASQNNIHTIITDHHTIPAIFPDKAYAVLHPNIKDTKYPYKGLTGSGVALKLAHALIIKFYPEDKHESELNSLLDLASMGTVADLGPLDGENRLIVKKGLFTLSNTKWPGLKKIMELAGVDLSEPMDTTTIGFKIGPRINAAGRIDHPYVALNLLLQNVESEQLNALGNKLEKINSKRQELTQQALFEVEKMLDIHEKNIPNILLANNENWHVGVVGLIAGRLAEKYARPAIIMQDFGDTLVGSARSPEFFNIFDALSDSKELLDSFGGHQAAAGFTIKKENLQAFKEKIQKFSNIKFENTDIKPSIDIDCTITSDELNFELLEKISKLEPFGINNQQPIFLISDIEPHFIDQVGKDSSHLKFSIKINDQTLTAIGFNMGKYAKTLKLNKKINIVFSLNKNTWKNKQYLQLHALDIGINGD